MQVSFIVPLYNCLSLTQAMLASLRATLPPGLAWEIIFVDDGSTDGTREWLAGFCQSAVNPPELSLSPGSNPSASLPASCRAILNEKNLGFAGACNRGAAAASGQVLFFLNNDLVLLPRWLEPMLTLVQRRDAALVGNIQRNAATGEIDHAGLWFNRKGKPGHNLRLPWLAWLAGRRRAVAVTGACFAIRAAAWRQLGGFDEAFVNGGEDVDLCLRARAAGLSNYVATRSVVRHHVSQSPGRKQRDEENSRRLLTRWRRVIAQSSVPDYCATCLEVAWEEPRNYPDPQLAREAFLYRCHLLPRPTARLAAATDAALEIEFRRWAHLLDAGPPPPPARSLAWQLFPPPQERRAVL